jgi:hypothetical protein
MLAIQTQPKYIQKTVQLPNGSWVLVVFELVEINGKITAKAVCGKILGQSLNCEEVILALPSHFESETIRPILSPFFSKIETILKDLSFVISQPSRAPNQKI